MSGPVIPQSTATLALDFLFTSMVADLALRYVVPPNVVFGWRQPTRQDNQGSGGANRVVIVPGDPSGKVGDLQGAKRPSRDPLPIATMVELATIYLWAVDISDPTDARKQWIAVRRLHDVVIPICIRRFQGRWKQISKEYLKPDIERPYGAEMMVVFAVEAMIPEDLTPQTPGGGITPVVTINGSAC